MEMDRQYHGIDVLKFGMAVLVASRHMIQVFFPVDSRWQFVISSWLSNAAVPVFFLIAGFFLFCKAGQGQQNTRAVIFVYCRRILRLYLLWSVLYLPVCLCSWRAWGQSVSERIRTFIQLFLFSGIVAHLWYLPALAAACLLVWFAYSKGIKPGLLLLLTGALFFIGCIGDNWCLSQHLPAVLQHLLRLYGKYFLTMRNGVFYGSFFVCLGLWFAKTTRSLPFWPAVLGAGASLGLMYLEARHFFNINMVLSSAPAAFFLFAAASSVKPKSRKLYPRLRRMSEWTYLSHFYFFYLFSWTARWNPVPFTERNTAVMVLGAVLLFSWCMACLEERKAFRRLRRMR